MRVGRGGGGSQGASAQRPLCPPGIAAGASASSPTWWGGRPLEFALSHLQSEAACNPRNPILMNLCAPDLAELGEIKLSKLISPPGRLEGDQGIAPDGIRVVLQPIHAKLQAASLWALPRFWGRGSPLQLSLQLRAGWCGVCMLVSVLAWLPRGPSLLGSAHFPALMRWGLGVEGGDTF